MDKKNATLFSRERQIILGTMLGGSSCLQYGRAKHHLVSMRGKDAEWIGYKASELRRLASESPITSEADGYLRWHSFSLPCLDEIRGLFYNGTQRCIAPSVFAELRDIALAIWLGDSGDVNPRGISLKVGVHGVHAKDCRQYFRDLDMPCNLSGSGRATKLVFDDKVSYRFLQICGHQVPPVLAKRYKESLNVRTALS